MAVAAAVAVVGGVLGSVIKGEAKRKKNRAAAIAADDNARSFETQAEFQEFVKERKKKIFKRDSEFAFGDNVSRYAKAGVDISGSPLVALAFEKQQAQDELNAIEAEGKFTVDQSKSQAANSRAQAKKLREANQFLPAQTFLGAATGAASSLAS